MATDEHWKRVAGAANQGLPYCSRLLELRDRIAALESLDCVSAILKLSRRVDALEAAQNLRQQDEDVERVAEPIATDAELLKVWDDRKGSDLLVRMSAIYDLGRKHGAAANSKPTPNDRQIRSSAPTGGLVERVATSMHPDSFSPEESWGTEARAAIRKVAEWLEHQRDIPIGVSVEYIAAMLREDAGR